MIPSKFSTVDRLSRLTRIKLTSSEKKRFSKELTKFSESEFLKRSLSCRPVSHPAGLVNSFRSKGTKPTLSQREALRNSKSTKKGYFKTEPELTFPQYEQ
ncbi:MAG: hypothetical protein PHS44_00915 [Candidatus Dojkabacteria bacterium]|nr:hypothetical protein [Candidatus Dojkabacteria bacterium]